MRRILLALVMTLPAAQARELAPDLAAMRQRMETHPVVRRTLSAPHRRATLVSGTLAETSAALERLAQAGDAQEAPRTLSYLRDRLSAATGTLEADFASIEARLAGLGLPEKVAAWHDFVRHYRARLAEVDAELAALAVTAGGLPRAELRARLAALRDKFGGSAGGGALESVKGPGRIEPGRSASAAEAAPRPADDTPTPADLAETKVVLLTEEIRALAQVLGGRPTALNNWVGTHIEYVPYLGQMQNSLSVLMSGRGNAFDQATLLIALLRSVGIPARYVSADVAVTREDVRDWLGVKDEEVALGLLSAGLLPLFTQLGPGNRVVVGHVWVEAYLETSSGKAWYSMDPARKRRSYQPGITLSRPPYDRMAYLRALKPVPPAEAYLDAMRAELQRRFPGRGFNEVPYAGSLLSPTPPTTATLYQVVKLNFRASEVPANLQHRVRMSLSEYSGQTTYLTVDLVLPEIVLQSIALSYNPATASDQKVVQAFGGLEHTPAAVVNLLPEFRMAGQVIATGKTPLPMTTAMDLRVTHLPPAQGTTQYVSRNLHTAGETAAVVLGANQIGEELLAKRISGFLSRLPAAAAAEATRGLLDIAAMRYLQRLGIETQRLADYLQVRFFQAAGVENAITFASLEPQNLFDRPFVVTPGRLRIHANPTSLPLLDLNRSDQSDPGLHIAWQLHNDASSVLEHEVWEELVMIPSASTIKILQTAVRDNVPIRTVNRANAATELRLIEASQTTRDTMQQRINAGATLTAPQRPVTIGSWKGLGWIEEYSDGWSFAYIIDFNSPGGDTGGTLPAPRPPASDPGTVGPTDPVSNTSCSDPVNVANGNLFDRVIDLVLRGQGPDIAFQRTYNSLALADGPLGPGWRHSFQMSLRDTGSAVTIVNESGAALNFPLVRGAYASPPGYNLTLVKDTQGYLLRRKNGAELRFDGSGALQSITDRNRNALQLFYEANRLRRVTDRAGRGITLSYDSRGRVATVEDSLGRRVSYEYDTAGRLAAATDPAGNRTVYAYYTDRIFNHLLKSVTTPEGSVTAWEYYGNGRVSRVTNPDGRTVNFLYLPMRNETHVIDPQGRLTSYQYNALGNVVREIRSDGSYIDSVYNADARLEARTDEAGYTTRFTYDAAGNMTSVTDPLGRTVRLTYEPAFNQVTSIRDARGNLKQFEYDARGNLTRVVEPLGVERRYTWDAAGNMTSTTDAGGSTVTMTYDSLGNPTEVRDALGNVKKLEFDRLNRMTRAVDALGGEIRLEYDALDRVLRTTDQLGRAASAAYDREGRQAQQTDAGGRTTKFKYDGMGHLAEVTDALRQVTQYGYATPDCGCPASASLLLFRDAAGYTRSQSYDSQDRLASTTDALGNTTRYAYDARGLLARKTDANGNVTTFEYDAAGQLLRKAFSDGTDVRFSYDAAGNPTAAWNQHVALSYTYDELNRVTSVTDSRFQKTIRYSYDRLGRRAAMTDPEGGVTSYAWDANRRLKSITAPSGASVAFGYDALGRLTSLNSTTLKYDAASRVLEVARAGETLTYTYDNAGNRTSVTGATGAHSYQYDELDRLIGAQHEALPAETYSYDAAGNRTGSATDPAYRYGAAGRLVSAEGATFTYDKNGNLTGKTTAEGTATYAWDPENRLVRVDLFDGAVASYKYDPFGRRIEKNVNGVVTGYLYDNNAILLELDADGQVTARYTHGPAIDWPLVMERKGQVWFYHGDALGSVAALTDSAGNIAGTYAYDAWGRARGAEAARPANPFSFAGRELDPETGLYYLRARYYDPAVGRFISPDPLDLPGLLIIGQSPSPEQALLPQAAAWALRAETAGLISGLRDAAQRAPQGLNAYAYAGNNPLLVKDPSGLHICGVVLAVTPEGLV